MASVPVVFNNLGVLYVELNDKARAINSFREALARDIDYRPVRLNLERMKDVMALGVDPVTHEVESNNSATLGNIIMPGKAVEAEIEAGVGDVDFFRVTTPPAPRDRISIEVTNGSKTLAPVPEDPHRGGPHYGLEQDSRGRPDRICSRRLPRRRIPPSTSRFQGTIPAPALIRCWCGP